LGALAENGNSARRADAEFPQLIIDPPDIALDRRKIVVKHSADGGYLCLGLGAAAELLRAVDEDDAHARRIDSMGDEGLEADDLPLARSADRSLRRLARALAFAKDGFDPNEPRDERGRWTDAGGGAAAATMAGAGASDIFTSSALVPALRQFAAGLLPSGAAGAASALGILAIPTNRSLISEGPVPDEPGLSYHFDQGTGVLTITREGAGGAKEVLYSGQHAGGVFRDSNGNIVGRDLGGSVVIDPDTIPGYNSRPAAGSSSRAGARARSDAAVDRDQPKLCPDPGLDSPGWITRSERALPYQEQITGLPRGFAVDFNGVSFDGCRERDGTLVEAKGLGFEWAMTQSGQWRVEYQGVDGIMEQADRQSKAARNRRIEWHFAEKPVADYFRDVFAEAQLKNITVLYTPAIRRKILV
jgi:Restriction endonuclease fold toxin 5